jgi:hypothetical protein
MTTVANPTRTQVASTFVVGASVTASVGRVSAEGFGRAEARCDACGFTARGTGFGETAKADAEVKAAEEILGHMDRFHRALKVGDGVTKVYPQDCYPYVVVDVSKNGKVATLVAMPTDPDALGGEPSGFTGPFPVWSKTFSQDELDAEVALGSYTHVTRISLRKDGKWRPVGADYVGSEVSTKNATYYRDYSW